ncbi:MAG: rhomboid family intramembrane serine protease [Chloroflexota bacterium]
MRYSRGYGSFNLGPVEFLIIANLLVFIATLFNGNLVFRELGLSTATFSQKPWTIITSMFVHDGFNHIFFNMFTLFFFGMYLVRLVGERNFLLIYFAGGILGGIFFLLILPPSVPAVGASGAIYSLGGALAVLRPKLPVFIFPFPVPIPLWIAVIGGALIISPGIAWQAHLGGLVLGLAAGYYLKQSGRYRW